MSQMSSVSLEQANEAKKALGEKLLKDFSVAVGGPIDVIGPKRLSTSTWGVEIRLVRPLKEEEKQHFPDKYDGVPVIYKIVSPQTRKPQEP